MIRRQWRRIAADATAPRKPSTAPTWVLWTVGILIGGLALGGAKVISRMLLWLTNSGSVRHIHRNRSAATGRLDVTTGSATFQ